MIRTFACVGALVFLSGCSASSDPTTTTASSSPKKSESAATTTPSDATVAAPEAGTEKRQPAPATASGASSTAAPSSPAGSAPSASTARSSDDSTTPLAPATPTKSPPDDPAAAVREAITQATQARRARDLAKAEQILEDALTKDPGNRQALLLLAETYQQHGIEIAQAGGTDYSYFSKSAQQLRKVFEIQPDMKKPANEQVQQFVGTVLYNEACAFARADESDKAIASLREAIDAGFKQLESLDTDEDLKSLRDLPEFKELKESVGKKEPQDKSGTNP